MTVPRPTVVTVIQARMNSSRLPGKIMRPLAGAPLLQRLVERVRRSRHCPDPVVATTDTPADDCVAALCAETGTACHRGSEDDVLGRVLEAVDGRGADAVARLTADNPFLDGALVDMAAQAWLESEPRPDYVHNHGDSGFPFGLFVEIASVQALREAREHGDAADREHVTWYLRQRPERFRHLVLRVPAPFPPDRLSLDTEADWRRLAPLFEKLYGADPAFSFLDLAASAATPERAR